MCGFSGFVSTKQSYFQNSSARDAFLNAAKKIVHRGSEPLKHDCTENFFIAHSRLAFQDLSPLSSQPLWSADREWVLIFNGEIYNYKELRIKIQNEFSYNFKSHGDSEVILAGFLCYKEKILQFLEGEYSFVIVKKDGSEVFAARDPFGVKPLFVYCENLNTNQFSIAYEKYIFETPTIALSSEIKGLLAKKNWNKEGFLRQAIGLYEPIRTPFENIIQVPQSSFLWAKKNFSNNIFNVTLKLDSTPIRAPHSSHSKSLDDTYIEFYETMLSSVEERLVSDVELGVYLSGGIDSKFVAACLGQLQKTKQYLKSQKLKSFTVGFDVEHGFDEANDAKRFASDAGFEPHVCRVDYRALQYSYPIAVYYSENVQPYTNGAAKWWLSRFARESVKGVLTGDGADEVLCGYPSFRYAAWWKFIFKNRSGVNVFDKIKNHPIDSQWRDSVYAKRFEKHSENPWLSGSSHAGSGMDFVESLELWGIAHPLFAQIKATAECLLGINEANKWLKEQRESVKSWFKFGFSEDENFYSNPENALLLWQNYFSKTHLPVQVLNWVGDRMEMANTLEGRPPFLSKKLKKFIYPLHDNFFVRGFEEKSILKRSFKRFFPEYMEHLPPEKKQFNAPSLFDQNPAIFQERILGKLNDTNLLNSTVLKELFDCNAALSEELNKVGTLNPKKSYLRSYLQSTIQTLLCFTYVDDFLVGNQTVQRDLDFEQSVLLRK